jgi:integrase
MARTVRDTALETRTARSRLEGRGKPYYRALEPGLHLGYRKPANGAGKWVVRHYAGAEAYRVETIATADDFSDADGVAILNFKQAQDDARKRMVARAKAAAGETGPYTVGHALDAYLKFLETDGRSKAAIKDACYRIEAFIRPALGNAEVASLRAERLRQWRDELSEAPRRVRTKTGEKQNYSGKTRDHRARKASANRTFTTLRAALNHAFANEKAPSDAAWRKVENFKNVDAARLRYLALPEARQLILASDPEFRPLVQAALQTGARYGELTRLTVADFNSDVGTIAIRQSKSGKPRHVVLTDEGMTFFRQVSAGRVGDEPMLRRADGSMWGKSQQALPMADAVARAKIKPPLGFHGLRHTWASHAVMNGVPLMVVARNLGHVSTTMVEKHYGHLAPSYIVDAIRAGAPRFGLRATSVSAIATE